MSVASSKKPSKEAGAPVTWGPAFAIVGTVAAYLASQIIVAALWGIFFGLAGWNDSQVDDWIDSTHGQFLIILSSTLIALMVLWLLLDMRRASWRALGLLRGPKGRDGLYVLGGFAVYFGLLIVANLLAQLVGVDTDQEQAIGYENAVSFFQLSLVFISLAVFPPVAEELLFRGFLFGGLRKKMTFVGAAVVTSIFFGALHLFTGMPGEGLIWIAAIDTFVLSMVLCYVREKTGAIWACIGIHAVKNSLAFLLYFVIK